MRSHTAISLTPRKTPVQARSEDTVRAIYEATIQVLLRDGLEKLTTMRVAARAGVSVGTLYQYYPHKLALLYALLEQHLEQVTITVEEACARVHGQPLNTMLAAYVNAYVGAKLARKDVSVALYSIRGRLEGDKLVQKLNKRTRRAVAAMLRTASDARLRDVDIKVFTFLAAAAGVTRAVLEAGATEKMIRDIRNQLLLLGQRYFAVDSTN
jgi:AcrR family transcriptional regulator